MAATKQNISGLAKLDATMAEASTSRRKGDPTVDGRDAPWVEKYRPKTLDDVAAHKEIIETIKRLTQENRLPHLLFYGPPGTGKTSTVLAIARQIYGSALQNMTLELNASDERGISVVREQIQDFASTKTIFSNKFKLIILDECDAMTQDAQNALRRVIEKYTRNARFCLICNYVSKIIPALQSRCTRFRFAPLKENYVQERLQQIVDIEKVKVGPGAVDAIVKLGGGDMRRTLNILQSCHLAFDEVSEEAVYACTGNPMPRDIEAVLGWLFNESLAEAVKKISTLQVERGIALADIVRELHPFIFVLPSLPTPVRVTLVEVLADIEHRLAYSTSEKLQLGALVGSFIRARERIVAAAV